MFSSLLILFLGLLALTRPSESRREGPQLLTEPGHFESYVGESVTLPCNVQNAGRRSAFWFKGNTPEERELIMQMKNVRGRFLVPRHFLRIIRSGKLATDHSNLIINDLSPEDSGSYTCSMAMVGQTVMHTLVVRGGQEEVQQPVITPQPLNGQMSVGEGRPATLSCDVSGSPEAFVSWYRDGDSHVLAEGPILNLHEIRQEDEGRYTCMADNGVSEPVSFSFDVIVEYVDVQARQTEVVASADHLSALLSCSLRGSPTPLMTWYDSYGPISPDDPRRYVYSRDNTYYLQLTQMKPSDLGEYQCYGYNEKARDHEAITVSAAPGSVRVLDATATDEDSYYRVSWEVDSLAPISFFYFAYREINSDFVMSENVVGDQDPVSGSSTLYRASTNITISPGHTYEIMVKAVADGNQPGPEQEELFRFTVPLQIVKVASSDEDAWKWWKMTMTMLSRLPQVVRAMNN